jgi:hypothetical protein
MMATGLVQETLFEVQPSRQEPNPCVVLYGPGPAGMTCGLCGHLVTRAASSGRRWYKCLLRRSSVDRRRLGAASTDHRGRWSACAKFVERVEDDQ